ncbi:hypothetical protein SAMN05660880_00588 [Luteibacter sp. 22Crub2.1]|nr:hypothetical protein SAMN05660880_00588 [Luteibacter sp. 22Crub2.1]
MVLLPGAQAFEGSASPSRLALSRRAVRSGRAGGRHPRVHACGDPSGRAATAAVSQWPSAGSGSDWGFSSRLSLPPRKRPVIPDRPRSRGLFQSEPSPAATGREGGTRRLFRTVRQRGVERRCASLVGTARLPGVHGLVRLSEAEGSRTRFAPTARRPQWWDTWRPVGARPAREKPTKRRSHTPLDHQPTSVHQRDGGGDPRGR